MVMGDSILCVKSGKYVASFIRQSGLVLYMCLRYGDGG